MTRIRALVLALLLAGVSCVACIPQPTAIRSFAPTPSAGRTEVVTFMDSLGRMSQDQALALFAAEPDLAVSYNATAGTEAIDWLPAMANVNADDVVVFELGTNDLSRLPIGQATWNALGAMNELADAECIVAFTLNTTGGDLRGPPFAAKTRQYNAFLRDLVDLGTYPQLRLYDWEAQSAGHPEWLLPDHLHHEAVDHPDRPSGAEVYAQAIVDAARSCV